ncbi:MAG: hypothetical protein LUC37_05590, partial [Prevotella sp.]|nr:hypothetical protein [Prevotella sp.]
NKFDVQFLTLANNISPKGMKATPLGVFDDIFTEYKRHPKTPYIKVMPLVLYNILESSNDADRNVENYIMLCEKNSSIKVTAIWDENYRRQHPDYICDLIYNMTGDFKGEE